MANKKTCLDCIWCKIKKGGIDKKGEVKLKATIFCDAGNWVNTGLSNREVRYWTLKGNDYIAPYSPIRIKNKIFKTCKLFEDATT